MQRWVCIHPDRHESIRSFREWAKSLPLEERKRIDGFKFFCEKDVWRWECVIKGIYEVLLAERRRAMIQPSQTAQLTGNLTLISGRTVPSSIEPLSLSGIRSAVETLRNEMIRPDAMRAWNELYYTEEVPPLRTVANVPRALLNPDRWGETISVDGSTSIDVSIPAPQTVQEEERDAMNAPLEWVWNPNPVTDNTDVPF
jgi:hypothetical protein